MSQNTTDRAEFHIRLEEILPAERILYDEPMGRHCSFRTGGPADVFAAVRTQEETAGVFSLLKREGVPYFVLGRGTNLLVGDGGFRGVVVAMAAGSLRDASGHEKGVEAGTGAARRTAGASERENVQAGRNDGYSEERNLSLDAVVVHGRCLYAGAGATLHAAAMAAKEHGLAGLEFAAGIPGTVGGALVMNAGAYGGEMKQVVRTADLLQPDGTVRTVSGKEMEFGYRTSILRHMDSVALGAEFVLEPGDPEKIQGRMDSLAAERRAKQPLEYPSAGSTFKRPEGYFAGKLIMDAGLRGFRIGDAQVSEKHCGFVINRGEATSAQIRQVIEAVQTRVFEDAGVRLEREVIYLGDFGD